VDDNIESLRKRHATYENETKRRGFVPVLHRSALIACMHTAVLDLFAAKGMLRKVDATREVDPVWTDIVTLFNEEKLA
jgi:adenylate kinase family enzyme